MTIVLCTCLLFFFSTRVQSTGDCAGEWWSAPRRQCRAVGWWLVRRCCKKWGFLVQVCSYIHPSDSKSPPRRRIGMTCQEKEDNT